MRYVSSQALYNYVMRVRFVLIEFVVVCRCWVPGAPIINSNSVSKQLANSLASNNEPPSLPPPFQPRRNDLPENHLTSLVNSSKRALSQTVDVPIGDPSTIRKNHLAVLLASGKILTRDEFSMAIEREKLPEKAARRGLTRFPIGR